MYLVSYHEVYVDMIRGHAYKPCLLMGPSTVSLLPIKCTYFFGCTMYVICDIVENK